MDKKPLIGVSILAVVLLVLGSLSNVVGYQTVMIFDNQPPYNPEITGPSRGKVGITYVFSLYTTDPENQNVSYYIEWGDGTITGWTPFYYSGQVIHYTHVWYNVDEYAVRCKAKDIYNAESNWTYLDIPIKINSNTVLSSYQQTIKEGINQRELLFQTIVDIANNKEIQRIILKSQMDRGIFPTAEIPVVTKNQLKQMYFIGFILSKFIRTSRIQSMVQKYQLGTLETQQEISPVAEKNAPLRDKITQLQNSECDCENDSMVNWDFPVMCEILLDIAIIFSIFPYVFFPIWGSVFFIAIILECYWTLP